MGCESTQTGTAAPIAPTNCSTPATRVASSFQACARASSTVPARSTASFASSSALASPTAAARSSPEKRRKARGVTWALHLTTWRSGRGRPTR
eukprot:8093896-Lingulodinium_polyedra.AAC.1